MSTPDLQALETLTRDYAAFQSRKSGLATALGGLMALLEVVAIMYAGGPLIPRNTWIWIMCAMPIVWLAVKPLLEGWLYRGLEKVKPMPDVRQERRRWLWIFALALFLLAFQTFFIVGFLRWNLECAQSPETLKQLPGIMAQIWHPWLMTLGLPLLYLVAGPLGIRGSEEARAYAVLTIQALFFSLEVFGAHGVWLYGTINCISAMAFFLLQIAMLAWAALAMVRGWKEHREYLAILRGLPKEEA